MKDLEPGKIVWLGKLVWNEQDDPITIVRKCTVISRDESFITPHYNVVIEGETVECLASGKNLYASEFCAYTGLIEKAEKERNNAYKQFLAMQEEMRKLDMLLSQTKQAYEEAKRGDPA